MRDLLAEGLAGIATHRFRSFLSTLGILFGVAAVIGILSIGEGARQEQEQLIEQLGVLNFQIRQREYDDPKRAEEVRRISRGLAREDARALARVLPEANQVGGMKVLEVRSIVPRPQDLSRLRVVGADVAYLAATQLRLVDGRPLLPRDEASLAQVCLLGERARRELFGTRRALGEFLRVEGVWLRVVGVFSSGDGAASVEGVDVDDRSGDIVLPLSTALERFPRSRSEPELSEIQVALDREEAVEGHTRLADRLLRRLHREQEDYRIVVPLRLLEQSRQQQRIFNLVMGLIAGISLLVGGIGIMNIMLASVLERTREVGIRLAVGATAWDIRMLFLVEASLISLFGGLAGVVVGYAIAIAVSAFTGWATAVSLQSVVLATALSMAEGVLFGLLPAQRAARLPPALAVRGR